VLNNRFDARSCMKVCATVDQYGGTSNSSALSLLS